MNSSSLVIHGEGTPRIIIPEDTAAASGDILSVNNLKVELNISGGSIDHKIINKQLTATNKYGKLTRGKVIDYDEHNEITVSEWDNEIPKRSDFTIQNEIIDLPFCGELLEIFTPVFYEEKELFETGELIRDLRGFRYAAIFNYEEYITGFEMRRMQNIYSAKRVNKFWIIPRSDNQSVFYKCEISDEPLRLAQLAWHQGHKYAAFGFKGVTLAPEINLTSTKNNKIAMSSIDGTIITDKYGVGISGN